MATTWNDYFPSKWIKSEDIPDGKNLVVTVKTVTYEPVGMDKEMRAVLRFSEIEKGLVLNVTNAGTLATLFGASPEACIGKRIALFATPVTFAGKTMLGIRINPKLPQQAARRPEKEILAELGYDDEEPAVAEPEFDEVM